MYISTIFSCFPNIILIVYIRQAKQRLLNFLKFKVELFERADFLLLSGMEKWLSGRKRFFAKEVNLKRVPRVRIPPSPPF